MGKAFFEDDGIHAKKLLAGMGTLRGSTPLTYKSIRSRRLAPIQSSKNAQTARVEVCQPGRAEM